MTSSHYRASHISDTILCIAGLFVLSFFLSFFPCLCIILVFHIRDLSNNQISNIAKGAFNHQAATLMTLDLSNNVLTYFHALDSMPSLQTVNLADNSLVSIGEGAFDNTLALSRLVCGTA